MKKLCARLMNPRAGNEDDLQVRMGFVTERSHYPGQLSTFRVVRWMCHTRKHPLLGKAITVGISVRLLVVYGMPTTEVDSGGCSL